MGQMTIGKVVYHPLTVLMMTIICVLFYWSLLRTDQSLERSRETLSKLISQTEKSQFEVEELEQKVQLASSAAYQEFAIRNELLMKKPGEFVVQLPDTEQTQSPNDTSSSAVNTPWKAWKQVLGL